MCGRRRLSYRNGNWTSQRRRVGSSPAERGRGTAEGGGGGECRPPRPQLPPPPCFAWSPFPVASDGGGAARRVRFLRNAGTSRRESAFIDRCPSPPEPE